MCSHTLNMHAQLYSGARGLNLGLSDFLYFNAFCMQAEKALAKMPRCVGLS